ncbi:hypothetical protein ACLB2K_036097 [Fragaria x ananassa]
MESPSPSPSPSPESIFLEDFGQKVDLTRRIREVLLNYPEGTTVLKELIQNADDAGATTVRLCLDRRLHGSDSLLSKALAPWQGPSLLAYNDAVFTEEDFVSISGSEGAASTVKPPRPAGSGLDSTRCIFLPNVSASNPGKRIDYVSSSAISVYRDQFLPYRAFGCDMKRPFSGTLFRFPLRNAEQAATSKLSRQEYSEDDLSSLLVQLYEEGVFTLLFLKSVLRVEMYVWDAQDSEPRKLYSCSVSSASDDIVRHRQAVLRFPKSVNSTESQVDCYSVDFVREALTGTQAEKRTYSFYLVQALASTSSRIGKFAGTASKEYDMHLLPWASVAACITDNSEQNDALRVGQAFCFLPLPVRTGLSVQVNGYFEVSSNHRGIWYGADMDRSGKIRSVWNRLLLEDVVAPAFTQLLLGIRGLLESRKLYYSLWPSGSFEEPWNILVEHIYRNISNAPVLYSEIEGGKWVSPVEAFLHDQEVTKSKELGEALIELGMPIVGLPNNLFDMLLKYASTVRQKVVTPDTVRCFLRECRLLSSLGKAYKLVLLEYCLEDLLDADVGTHAYNLPLLPLANGEFGLLSEATKGISYFICSDLEFRLSQQIYDRIVDRDIPMNLLHRLSAIAKSSKANLLIFNVQYFLHFFPRFVPADWKYKSKVCWDPESCHNHPTSSWFVLFWQYLRNQCDKLSIFSEWPILPSTSGHLYRASRESKLMNAEKLSDKVQGVLVKIGCKILNPNYGVEHSDLFHYVSDGNATGLVKSIYDAVSLNCGTIETCFHSLEAEERDELRSFLLDPKWYFGDCLNESAIQNCKRLPIYKVYGGGSTQSFQFSDLENPRKYLLPLDIPECFLGAEFLISSDTELQILLRYYGIERMGKAHFYKQQVLNRVGELQPEVRNNIVLSIIQNLPQLCIEDTSFREYLRNLEFLPTLSGALRCPTALYDPRNEELYALLDDSDSFPYGPFQEPGILDMLQGLGLRTSVNPETIIQSARQVERLMHEDQQKAHLKGKVLLSYLEVNAMKWIPNLVSGDQGTVNRMFLRAATAFRPRNLKSDLEKFWNDLWLVSWCPVLVSSPFLTLPWPVVSSTVAPPKLVRLQADMWLVSASMRILDGEYSSTALSSSLGWSSPPGGSVIAAQLLELGKNNEIVNDQVLRQELAVAMPRIYSILAGLISSDEMDIVKAVLEGSRWIWVGDGFATVDEVVLNGPIHLAPYIRVIPVDLAVFKELFLELGIREFLKPTDFANILCRMALKKGSTPLDSQEIRAALLVVQHLAEVQIHDQKVKIYLPDVSGRLYPAGDLVYNDAPWLLGSEDHDSPFGGSSNMPLNARRTVQKFVHGNISINVAEKLGVCSLRRILLAESADSMNLSLSGSAEAFGQHEALTTRLKHILEMYADGPGILFELVQNAEDAGASEVNFLLDKTQYGTSSVLSPEMADWQGPALYCFNDSVFSPQDLYAISRIGQESKLEKPFAIGRFGLGFNCVYHFTDIPTFVSGENIVMFDPHACNLPGISPSHPGLRIKFSGRKIMEQFPDQFSPFLHFGCDLQHPFPGTLFRFPLRSASAASRSQIKKEGYAPEDVMSLFSSFSKVVSETLLFLRNVKVISVFVKEGSGHEMKLLHRVNKHSNSEPEMEPNAQQDVFGLFDGNRHNGMDKEQFLKKLRNSAGKGLPYKCQKVKITEESSSGNVSHSWITSEYIGGGQAKKKFPVFSDKSHTYFPWACVAAYLHSSKVGLQTIDIPGSNESCAVTSNLFQGPPGPSEDRKDIEGRAFCFLPLPITTGLPAHVNAYFELSSNRRDIWFGNDMAGGGKKRSDWNMYLLEGVVAPAYGHMLEKIAPEIGPCDLFFSLWPKTRGSEPWALVVRELYTFIADCGLRVLYTKARGGQWISTKQAIFPDFTFDKVDELIEALSDAGLPLVTVSKPIVERFQDVCPALHFLTPQLLKTLLIRRKREFKDRITMILALEYCLLDLKMPVQSAGLYGLPLLPLADGSFTIIDKNGIGERIYIVPGDEYDLLKDSVPNLLDDEMTKDIPCMDYAKIKDLLALYGDNDLLLFDLLELADCCKANKLHLIFDKREHPRQSLLQHNMGEFQGPALLAVLEGANLSREEVSSLQFLPPWRLRGATVNYGLALLSCYFVCDLLSVVSGGYYYMFDPCGSVLAAPSTCTPAAKMFSLTGTNLTDRFRDQFNPMLIGHSRPWQSSDSTIIRMPLSSECLNNELEFGLRKIKQITEKFLEHSSRSLLFLKSVMQVSISTWEEGSAQPCHDYSVSIDASYAIMRNPFSEKKWRKFQISRLFNSSNAATKLQVIDVNLKQGEARVVDRWLVALSVGSGQTRNMALDRRYLAYNLTPVAGVAAHISRDGYPVDVCLTSSIMSPLPLSGGINIPVTVLGCFLVCHNEGRSLFNYQDKEASSAEARVDAGNLLMEAWNKELMSCVRDSYIGLILEIQRLRLDPSSSTTESSAGLAVSLSLKGYRDQIYSFWPRSNRHNLAKQPGDGSIPSIEVLKSDWECVIEQVISPFYARIVDLPVWQLYSGNFAKAEEGMFLSQPGHGVGGNLLPATVCSFVKEHYPVFSVPWELVTEIQALGITVREVKPKMVRNLLRVSSSSIVLRSVDMYADVLEYCLSDIEIGDSFNSAGNSLTIDHNNTRRDRQVAGGSSASQSSTNLHTYPASSTQNAASSGDAIEMVTSLGKALFDFGRGVVEDIGRSGGPLVQRNMVAGSSNSIYGDGDLNLLSIAAELRGLPCPTAANRLTKLGFTELWVGNTEQQALMASLAEKFVHPKVLDRPILADIFLNGVLQSLLKLQSFSLHLLASHMKLVFHTNWASYVMGSNMVPWFSWENNKSSSGGEGGPSPEWIRLFWKNFNGSSEDLLLFSDWPLIPAFLGRPILCRVRERDLVFIPPLLNNHMPESETIQSYISAFEVTKNQHPWLLSLLNHCNIPIFDIGFLHCAAPSNCFPPPEKSLGQVIASKMVAAKTAGYFSEVTSLSAPNCDALFALFANDFLSNGSNYRREELEVLRSLPIYKTVVGSYTRLISDDLCMISTNSFLKPFDERCLSYTTDSVEFTLLRALGVPELHDQQILIRFGLPGFEGKPEPEKEDVLIYLYTNWQDLQMDTAVVEALKETKFVRNADEFCTDLYRPKDLFDPGDALLTSVFSGERKKFPGERFFADWWLQILRKTGLRTAIESDVILECAKRVEFLGSECMRSRDLDDFDDLTNPQSEVSMEVWTLAGSVIEAIFSNFAVLYSNNFCDLLGKIKCIPAEFGFPNVAGKKGGKRVLTSYSEAILLKDWPLAWSCAPILSRQNVVPPDYSWGSLQLRSPPAFPTVIKHLQIIGRNGGEDTLAHWPTVSGMMTVDDASCEVLKYLDKIWNSLSSSDITDLQRVPFIPAANGTRLVTANLLFARLTINLSPFAFELPSSYLPFLKILKALGLQDMLSIASARDLLLNLQKTCGYQRLNPNELRAVLEILYFICDGATADDMSNGPNWKSAAIVPDDSCRLVHANSCAYIDSHGSRFVKRIDPSRLRFIHPDLPERFCTVLGIKKLSDVVSSHRGIRSRGTCGIFGSYSISSNCSHPRETVEQVTSECYITHAAKESIIPEWVNGSMHRTLYFINRTNTCILVSEPPPYISVFDVIAIVVSLVLGSPTPLPIGSLFICPGGSETAIIDLLKLCSDKQEMEATSGSNGLVGKELLPQDVRQVQFHPLRPFYTGEIVAWRSQNGEKLKYGRVPEDVRPSAGQALYRFKVETSLGLMQPLLSSHVFSFKSVAMGSESLPMSMDDAHTIDHSRTCIDMPETSGSGKSRASQPQAGKDLQYGLVSPAELVQAVQEMLSAAGIYMDVEKQSLLQKTLTLQEQLKESQTSLLLEQEKADAAAKEADTAKAAWVCRVCLSAEVDITIVPCGHVLCRRCSSAVSRCPFCRLQVSKTLRIFRP